MIQTNFVANNVLSTYPTMYKTTQDLLQEGELFVRAVGEFLNVKTDSDPYLFNAFLTRAVAREGDKIPVQCIYRDLQNRPPTAVQAILNDTAIDLKPARPEADDYREGVLYYGFIPAQQEENEVYFTASNEQSSIQIPLDGSLSAPYVLMKKRKK
jgi:hypothetical protein